MSTPGVASAQRVQVYHRTVYRYGGDVTSSSNTLRLMPRPDRRQNVRSFALTVNPIAPIRPFEDPFGNHALELRIDQPHRELTIESTSVVEIDNCDPFARLSVEQPITLPVPWNALEATVLEPYRTPPMDGSKGWEAVAKHARDAAFANHHNLTETLFALNLEIFREFEYAPGTTTPETPVTDVYAHRRGVCQDFAGLYIAWARSLGIPARYVWGYLLLDRVETKQMDEATHAWVEVYVPKVGWMGFDPTNGVLADFRYVAVAHSRSPCEAPPILGWLEPAQSQTLEIEVRVQELPDSIDGTAPPPSPTDPPTHPRVAGPAAPPSSPTVNST